MIDGLKHWSKGMRLRFSNIMLQPGTYFTNPHELIKDLFGVLGPNDFALQDST